MWGNGANCYAYACNCKTPANGVRGAAVPGGIAGQGVFVRANDTADQYADRLILGVLLDAQHNGLRHAQVSRNVAALPDAGAGYIIAMVSGAAGFHFFRRDRANRRWSWKDGIPAEPDNRILRAPAAAMSEVDDAMFVNATVNDVANCVPNWPNMQFRAYFALGDINGMTVAGIAAANAVMA